MRVQNPYLSVMTSLAVLGIAWCGKTIVDSGKVMATLSEQTVQQGVMLSQALAKIDSLYQAQWQQHSKVQQLEVEIGNLKSRLEETRADHRELRTEVYLMREDHISQGGKKK